MPDVVLDENAKVEPPAANKVVNITSAVKDNALSARLSGNLAAALNLTDAEKASGVWAWVEVDALAYAQVDKEDAARITAGLKGNTLGMYLDISLFKQAPEGDRVAVAETGRPVTITIVVPQYLRAANRTFSIAYTHNGGDAELISPVSYNEKTGELVFQASQFSTYALVYKDVKTGTTAPNTGDNSNGFFYTVTLCTAALGLALLLAGKKKKYIK